MSKDIDVIIALATELKDELMISHKGGDDYLKGVSDFYDLMGVRIVRYQIKKQNVLSRVNHDWENEQQQKDEEV